MLHVCSDCRLLDVHLQFSLLGSFMRGTDCCCGQSSLHAQVALLIKHHGVMSLVCTQTRADIQAIKQRLDTGMAALASTVAGNPAYAAKQLDDLKPLVLPLLASPIVGEGSAYDAAYALARCLPAALHDAAFAVASALQMVMQSQLEGKPPLCFTLASTYSAFKCTTAITNVFCVSAGSLQCRFVY